jgi:flavin-binding protein dodecin
MVAASPAMNEAQQRTMRMSNNVYSVTEVYGSSEETLEAAIESAISTAATTLRNLDWFEVTEIRGHIENDKVAHYQVGLKLGLRYEK